jgi:hypothetical protein
LFFPRGHGRSVKFLYRDTDGYPGFLTAKDAKSAEKSEIH